MALLPSSDLLIPRRDLLLLLQLLLLLLLLQAEAGPQLNNKPSDTDALSIFRHRADTHGNLAANWTAQDACKDRWRGVGCSINGRVVSLVLSSLDLRGPLDALSHLDQLRVLDLHDNRLNGTLLPLLPSLGNLKLLYLSRNDLSGPIPDSVALLKRLLRLDLSENNLSGSIPVSSLANLTRLLTLRVQNNLLSGPVPDLSRLLPQLTEFNASNNELYGSVPDGLRTKFGLASLAGNAGLCGPSPPLPLCSSRPDHEPPTSPSQTVVPSNPSSMPDFSAAVGGPEGGGRGGLSAGAVVGIVVGNTLFLLLVVSLLVAYCCARQRAGSREEDDKRSSGIVSYSMEERKKSAESREGEEGAQSKLVFFEDEDAGSDESRRRRGRRRRMLFELDDLLRASAEMLGKGTLGTVYRAVLEDGCMVAVKRLRDADPCPRREFDSYMGIIGRLRHPNLVTLRAYYSAKQEKLLIYDYIPNGNLHSLLHGNRKPGSGRSPLDWTTRISLVLGAACGLAHIHEEYGSSRISHGNIKSSNVLLDKNGAACISDFGLALLLNPAHTTARLAGYRAPEQADNKALSQEADVYAFGVLLLEVLTGVTPTQYPAPPTAAPAKVAAGIIGTNLPEWVRSVVQEEWTAEVFDAELTRYKNIEGEMYAMLHVALACVAQQPEMRPTMMEVVKMIEEIRVEQSPLAEDLDDPRASRSPSLATTTATDDALA